MKFPEKVSLGGKTFKIIMNEKGSGGQYSCSKGTITLDTCYEDRDKRNEREVTAIFLHEIIEAAADELEFRYLNDNGSPMFFMSHMELTSLVNAIVEPILELVELNRE